jgi:hypothetical protein
MLCKKVLPLLSDFFDEVLDADTAVKVSQHLDQCIRCRKELDSLSALHGKLRSLSGVRAPEYLHRLVQHRLTSMQRDSWRMRLKNELERRWSKIRTTEGMWYVTRALGTVMTSVFFFLIFNAISPLYVEVNAPAGERRAVKLPAYSQQVGRNVLAKFGMLPASKLYTYKSKPAINDQYLVEYAQSISGKDDTFSVLAAVDPSGAAKIQNVLQYPDDQSWLSNLNEMISSAPCRPATENGEAVSSHMVMVFSKVSVYD